MRLCCKNNKPIGKMGKAYVNGLKLTIGKIYHFTNSHDGYTGFDTFVISADDEDDQYPISFITVYNMKDTYYPLLYDFFYTVSEHREIMINELIK